VLQQVGIRPKAPIRLPIVPATGVGEISGWKDSCGRKTGLAENSVSASQRSDLCTSSMEHLSAGRFVSPLSLSLGHALTAAGVLSPSQLDPYPSFGPQSETGERLNRMAGDRAELESLGNGGEYECGLHHRERGSDTLPRSGP